jgi:hypothetical protein
MTAPESSRFGWSLVALALVALALPGVARADAKKDDDKEVEWGMGVKARRWHVTKRLQKWFVEDSPGPAWDYGVGIDFVRRLRDTEIAFGFGYDPLDLKDGYWVEKGGDPTTPGKVDYTTFNDLEWLTAEVTVVKLVEIHKLLEFRFGVGIGVGYLRGDVRETDALCTSDRVQQDCAVDPTAMEEIKDIPPVLPVINLLAGLQFKPFRFLHLHVDAGLHTTPYVGAGATFYLW